MIFTGQTEPTKAFTASEFAKECYPSLYRALGFPLRHVHGCTFGETRVKYPLLNGVYNCQATIQELPVAVGEIRKYYEQLQLPYSWWIEEEKNAPFIQATLQENNCTLLDGKFCSMLCLLDQLKEPRHDPEFHLKQIANVQTLSSWSALLCHEFSMPADIYREYAEIFIPAGFQGPCYHFAGMYQNQMVTTGSLLCLDFGAYIYNITTKKEFRGKGFASLMTQNLLQFAKQQTLTRAALFSAKKTAPLYQKLGFKMVSDYRIYVHI